MMCALSNARSAIPACAFRSVSKRDSYAVLDKRYLRAVAGDTRERGRFVFTEESLIRAEFSDYFMHSPNVFRPAALDLPMWSRPAMLGSIRKRASVWRGPVRSSFPLGVPQRHYTCSNKIVKVTGLQALRDYCVAVIKSFLRKFHFWKWGRRKWAGRSEDCRPPAYGGDIAPTCAAPHATTICRSKSTNAPWAIRRGSGSCPHRSSFRTLLRQF